MVKSIQKAVHILLLLSNFPDEAVSLNKIANGLNIDKSTCCRILDTLCNSLMVEKVSRTDGYRLGPTAYFLTRYGKYQGQLLEISRPLLEQLRQSLDATIILSVVSDGVKYIIFHDYAFQDYRFDARNSEIVKGHIENSATGTLLMAYMDSTSLNRVSYRNLNLPFPPCQTSKYERIFKTIRSNGYFYREDHEAKLHTYAFRIHNGTQTIASLGILYPYGHDSPEIRLRTIRIGKKVAEEISRQVGCIAELSRESKDVI